MSNDIISANTQYSVQCTCIKKRRRHFIQLFCDIFLVVNVAWWLLTRVVGSAVSKRASRAVVVAVPGATVRWAHRKIINTINSLNSGAAPSQLHPTCGHNCTAPAASHTCHVSHYASASPLSANLVIWKVYLSILLNKYLFTLLIQLCSMVFWRP